VRTEELVAIPVAVDRPVAVRLDFRHLAVRFEVAVRLDGRSALGAVECVRYAQPYSE